MKKVQIFFLHLFVAYFITGAVIFLLFYIRLGEMRLGFPVFPFQCPVGEPPCVPLGFYVSSYRFYLVFFFVLCIQGALWYYLSSHKHKEV